MHGADAAAFDADGFFGKDADVASATDDDNDVAGFEGGGVDFAGAFDVEAGGRGGPAQRQLRGARRRHLDGRAAHQRLELHSTAHLQALEQRHVNDDDDAAGADEVDVGGVLGAGGGDEVDVAAGAGADGEFSGCEAVFGDCGGAKGDGGDRAGAGDVADGAAGFGKGGGAGVVAAGGGDVDVGGGGVGASLPLALVWLDRAVTSMMTLSGFVLDGMTRNVGWRFLSMGRRIERLMHLCTALQTATIEGRSHSLDWLLELTDSVGTYRSRYMVAPEWLPVLDMLLRDDTNPRSVAFQVKGLADYIAKLELRHGRFASDVVAPAQIALRDLTPADLYPESPAIADLLDVLRKAAGAVSDELTLKFFSHAMSRSVLSLVA